MGKRHTRISRAWQRPGYRGGRDRTGRTLLVTRLRTVKNEEIVVPNSLILNNHVMNYSTLAQSCGLILHTTVGIGYETPWRQVEAMLRVAVSDWEG